MIVFEVIWALLVLLFQFLTHIVIGGPLVLGTIFGVLWYRKGLAKQAQWDAKNVHEPSWAYSTYYRPDPWAHFWGAWLIAAALAGFLTIAGALWYTGAHSHQAWHVDETSLVALRNSDSLSISGGGFLFVSINSTNEIVYSYMLQAADGGITLHQLVDKGYTIYEEQRSDALMRHFFSRYVPNDDVPQWAVDHVFIFTPSGWIGQAYEFRVPVGSVKRDVVIK